VYANAIISGDEVLTNTLSQGYDMHCNNSSKYFKEEIESILGPNDGSIEWNKRYKSSTATNDRLDKLRSMSKAITFSLQYLAAIPGLYKAVGYLGSTFEDTVKIKDYMFTTDVVSAEDRNGNHYYVADFEANWYDIDDYKLYAPEKVHDFFEKAVVPAKNMHYAFHNELYYGAKAYRDETILGQARKYKDVHLGMGCYINQTTKLNMASVRCLNNVCYQFYSILSILALEKFRRLVVQKGLSDKVKVISSIYDSVYILVKKDKELVSWVAKTIQKVLTEQFVVGQSVPLQADVEMSTNSWADFKLIKDLDNIEF
jgi:hypothetical protein